VQSENGGIKLIAGSAITIGSGSIASTGKRLHLLQARTGNISQGGSFGWNCPTAHACFHDDGSGREPSPGRRHHGGQDWSMNLVARRHFASANSVNTKGAGIGHSFGRRHFAKSKCQTLTSTAANAVTATLAPSAPSAAAMSM